MKKLTLTLIAAFCLGPECVAQDIFPAPDFRRQSADLMIPTQPAIAPPDLPPRPLLLQQPVQRAALPEQSRQYLAKSPLTWRAKAHKLKSSTSPADVIIASSYEGAVDAITRCVLRYGMKIDVLNYQAGELVASSMDPQSTARILIVFSEMPPGSVNIRTLALNSGKNANIVLKSLVATLAEGSLTASQPQTAPLSTRGSF